MSEMLPGRSEHSPGVVSRRVLFALGILVLLSPFVAVIANILQDGFPDTTVVGDGALMEISTRNTAAGTTLTGPSSRLEFAHPGPFYFILRIPLYYLTGFAASSSLVTSSLIWAFCLACSAIIVHGGGSNVPRYLCLLILALYLLAVGPMVWMNDWNAFVVIPAMFLCVFSLAAAVSGSRRSYIPAFLSGSFAAQTHLGCVPSVAALVISAIALDISTGGSRERLSSLKHILLATLLSGLFWAPVLFDQFWTRGGGNISAIVSFFRNTPSEPVSLAYIRAWVISLSSFELPSFAGEPLKHIGLISEYYAVIAICRILLLTACWFISRRIHGCRFFRSLCILSLILHATTLLSTLQIREGLHQHLMVWFSLVGSVSWIAVAGVLARFVRPNPRMGLLLIPAAILLTGAASLTGIRHAESYDLVMDSDVRVEELAYGISQTLQAEDGARWFIRLGDHELWPLMAGLVNELQKRGYDCEVDPVFEGMTGIAPQAGARPVLLSSDSLWNDGFREVFRTGDVRLGIESDR